MDSLHQVLLLLLVYSASLCLPMTVKIGAILSDETEESVFRLAVEFVNEQGILGANNKLQHVSNRTGIPSTFSVIQIVCEQISAGAIAFIGPKSSELVHSLSTLSTALHIPVISPLASDHIFKDTNRYPYMLRMLPPDCLQSVALVNLLQTIGWKRLTILTSNTEFGMHWLLGFESIAAERELHIVNFQYFEITDHPNDTNATKQLRIIYESGSRIILLNCLAIYGMKVLEQAHENGMLGPGWAWIVTDKFTGSNKASLPQYMSGLLGIQPVIGNGQLWKVMEERWLSANQTNYPGAGDQLNPLSTIIVDSVLAFSYGLRDLLKSSKTVNLTTMKGDCLNDILNDGDKLMQHIKRAVGDGVASDLEFSDSGSPMFPRYDIVNLQSRTWRKVGRWRPGSLDFNTKLVRFPGNRLMVNDFVSKLANRTLRIVTIKENPFVHFTTEDFDPWDIQKGQVEGLVIDLLDRLAELAGFNYSLYYVPDRLYGKKDESTFQWNGLIKEVHIKEADMAAAPLTISVSRETDVDFTTPYLDLGLRFILKVPTVLPERAFRFLDPLKGEVWMMTLVMMVLVGLYVSLLNKLSPYDHHGGFVYRDTYHTSKLHRGEIFRCYREYRKMKRIKIQRISILSFSNSVWFCIAALLQQGCEYLPKSISARIATMSWFFAIVIIVATYTANLAAFLTSSRIKTSIDSIEELGAQTKVRYGTVKDTAIHKFFEDSNITLFRDMFFNMNRLDTYLNISDVGVSKTRDGGYAFIYDSPVLDYVTQQKPCNTIRTVGKFFGKIGYGFALQKNSPYKDELSYYILKLREEGYIARLVRKWYHEKGECSEADHDQKHQESAESISGKLNISQMFGIFLIVYAGMALSFLCLIIEWIVATKSHVDKRDPFVPDTFRESLSQRMAAVGNDFHQERQGYCRSSSNVNLSSQECNSDKWANRRVSVPKLWTVGDARQSVSEDPIKRQKRPRQRDPNVRAKGIAAPHCDTRIGKKRLRRASLPQVYGSLQNKVNHEINESGVPFQQL